MISKNDELYNISKAPIGNFIHNMILNEPNKEVLLFCGFAYKIDDITQLLYNVQCKHIIKHIEDVKGLNDLKYSVGEDVHIILIAKYGIPLDYKGDKMFDITDRALGGEAGVWTHTSYRPYPDSHQKWDTHPDPNLKAMLRTIATL